MERELKRKLIINILILVIILILSLIIVNLNNNSEKEDERVKIKEKTKVELNDYVITKKQIYLYKFKNNKYNKVGMVSKDIVLHLESTNNDYYKVLDLDQDYYVKINNLLNYDEKITYSERYKKYIPFNLNIYTEEKINLYDENNNLVYSIKGIYSLPIIVKEEKRYGVEFAGRLLYVKNNEVEVIENNNTDETNTKGIPTLNYHFFYDENASTCNQEICASKSQFQSHLDYIKENNILTLKMEEVEMYIDNKIQLPQSVLITIDDGWETKIAVDMLTEYQMYGTIFLVTSWHDVNTYYKTEYIELHSHTDNMHNTGECPTGQGGGIQCLDEEKIQNDLKVSREKLNNTTYFCYPFYEYNDYSIEMLQKAGFTMAFVGESSSGDNLIKVGSNKFKLPRFVIVNYTTMYDFSKYLSSSK